MAEWDDSPLIEEYRLADTRSNATDSIVRHAFRIHDSGCLGFGVFGHGFLIDLEV